MRTSVVSLRRAGSVMGLLLSWLMRLRDRKSSLPGWGGRFPAFFVHSARREIEL
jgi:hypothetical protein